MLIPIKKIIQEGHSYEDVLQGIEEGAIGKVWKNLADQHGLVRANANKNSKESFFQYLLNPFVDGPLKHLNATIKQGLLNLLVKLFSDEKGFKIIRRIFHSPTLQKLFQLLPPRIGQNFGYAWSKSNREKILHLENNYQGEENEPLVVFAKKFVESHDVDFLIFGHRHIELDLELKTQSRVIILGDFIGIFSYGIFDGVNFRLEADAPA